MKRFSPFNTFQLAVLLVSVYFGTSFVSKFWQSNQGYLESVSKNSSTPGAFILVCIVFIFYSSYQRQHWKWYFARFIAKGFPFWSIFTSIAFGSWIFSIFFTLMSGTGISIQWNKIISVIFIAIFILSTYKYERIRAQSYKRTFRF